MAVRITVRYGFKVDIFWLRTGLNNPEWILACPEQSRRVVESADPGAANRRQQIAVTHCVLRNSIKTTIL